MTVALLGEALGVLRPRGHGSLVHVGAMEISTGGAELNVAIGLARLGVEATWVGRLGDDGFGRRVLRDLRGEGVTVHASLDPEAPTGLLVKESPYAGATHVTYYRSGSAGSQLTAADLDPIDFETLTLLHVTGITAAISPGALSTLQLAVERARAAGVPVSFDINHRSRLWRARDPSPTYRWLAERADLVFAGEDEAVIVLEHPDTADPFALAEALARLGPAEVVIKRGALGAVALSGSTAVQTAAVPVAVVDTVGAGDAFVAGYLAQYLIGAPVAERLALAVAAGAAACTHPGDWEGSMTRTELLAMTTRRDPVTR